MTLYVYNPARERIGLVEDVRSLQWLSEYQDAGEIKLVCSATEKNRALLVDGNRLYCTEQPESAIIRQTQIDDDGKDAKLTVRAVLSAARWADRVVMATEQVHNAEAGMLSLTTKHRRGLPGIIIPRANAAEGAVFPDFPVYAADSVEEVLRHLRGEETLPLASSLPVSAEPEAPCPDFADVKGQPVARRAAEVAAAGGHNLLLLGSPGSGKSMIAQRLPSILPELSFEESIETTQIHSIAGLLPQGVSLLRNRPFRAPHHTVSAAGLTGGGSNPRPGEISLAHNGVLFLDELPEFSRSALEALRQPMENSRVTISRAGGSVTYPSRIMAVAAMNPCPCGYYGHPDRPCTCTPSAIKRYLGRVSGPLLDRLDIQVEVAPVRYEDLASASREEGSAAIRERVAAARKIQQTRLAPYGESCNARIPAGALGEVCPLTPAADRILQMAFERLNLSGRAYDRILKIARTIADLDGSECIDTPHITEAIQYRSLDRKYWAGR